MTKFGWLVILGIVIVLGGIGGGAYVVMHQQSSKPSVTSDPNQQIEVVLPPDSLTQEASSTEAVATSSHATASTTH